MQANHTVYYCDDCGCELPARNRLTIVTEENDSPTGWRRLLVLIKHQHGSHNNNNFQIDDAELCQSCTVKLLTDALDRVRNGERASAGVETSERCGWTAQD